MVLGFILIAILHVFICAVMATDITNNTNMITWQTSLIAMHMYIIGSGICLTLERIKK